MDLKDYLTNEKVSKKFVSQFELVNYAIKLATNMIHTGRDSRVKSDSQNRSMQILNEILNDKDVFDDIVEVDEGEINQDGSRRYDTPSHRHENVEQSPSKSTERKKNRKILAD